MRKNLGNEPRVSAFNNLCLRHERRAGFFMILLLLVFVGFFVFVGMKATPDALEYMNILRAVSKIESAPFVDKTSVREAFDRYAAIDGITSISGKDLAINPGGAESVKLGFHYEKRIEILHPVFLLLDFKKGAGE